jgi:hypothetical protein
MLKATPKKYFCTVDNVVFSLYLYMMNIMDQTEPEAGDTSQNAQPRV